MWGKEQTLPKILAISQHAMQWWCWKSRQGRYALEWEAVARPQQRIRVNKITSKLGLRLNFAVNVDFGFAMMISIKKKLKAKTWFLLFFYDVKNGHFCFCPKYSNADILQKSLIFLCWVSQFERLSSEWSQLKVKAMFAWLRKLQYFKAVESCTGAYGRIGC